MSRLARQIFIFTGFNFNWGRETPLVKFIALSVRVLIDVRNNRGHTSFNLKKEHADLFLGNTECQSNLELKPNPNPVLKSGQNKNKLVKIHSCHSNQTLNSNKSKCHSENQNQLE